MPPTTTDPARPPSSAYTALVAKAMSEDELQENVRRQAGLFRWLHYHTRDSRRSEPGFMDSALARPPRFILAELKNESDQPTPDQRRWLDTLQDCPGVEIYLWRPRHWLDGTIERILR